MKKKKEHFPPWSKIEDEKELLRKADEKLSIHRVGIQKEFMKLVKSAVETNDQGLFQGILGLYFACASDIAEHAIKNERKLRSKSRKGI